MTKEAGVKESLNSASATGSNDLLCCPFCGYSGQYYRISEYEKRITGWWMIKCPYCKAQAGDHATPEEARNRWNNNFRAT